MKCFFDHTDKIWIDAENESESRRLNRFTLENLKVWVKSKGGMSYMNKKEGEPTFAYIALDASDEKESTVLNAKDFELPKTFGSPSESCDQSETFCWKTAAILIGRGEEVQVKACGSWIDFDINHITISFPKDFLYRRKPSPATPDKKEEESDTYKTNKIRLSIIDLKLRVSAIEKALHANGIYE